jgi:glycosyltransferase involved in cell wall biosynthesis
MKISIITICYNPGDELKAAIESVLSQQGVDVEYILVDGGSTDGTVEYVRSLNGQIATFVSEPDHGLYDALNKGIRLATGDIIGLLHADDFYVSEMALSLVAKTVQTTGADAVYGDMVYVDKINPDRIIRYWKSGDYNPEKLKFGWMPPHPTLFLKREVYEKAKLPNGEYFDTTMTCAADYDFMMRLLKKMSISIVYLPVVLVNMRMGGISNKSIKHLIRKSHEDYTAMRRNNIGGLGTLVAKNLRKLPQFFKRKIRHFGN